MSGALPEARLAPPALRLQCSHRALVGRGAGDSVWRAPQVDSRLPRPSSCPSLAGFDGWGLAERWTLLALRKALHLRGDGLRVALELCTGTRSAEESCVSPRGRAAVAPGDGKPWTAEALRCPNPKAALPSAPANAESRVPADAPGEDGRGPRRCCAQAPHHGDTAAWPF